MCQTRAIVPGDIAVDGTESGNPIVMVGVQNSSQGAVGTWDNNVPNAEQGPQWLVPGNDVVEVLQ